MTRLKSKLLEIPASAHGILEFAFFCGVGFTAGSLGLIWWKLLYKLFSYL